MRLSKRPRRPTPFASLNQHPALEARCLPAAITFIGQDGSDYVGPDAGVGPDGIQDLHIKLTGLDPSAQISFITVAGPNGSGFRWESESNPAASADAHFVRDATDPSVGHLYINPRVRSNLDPTVSDGSSTGSLISLASGATGGTLLNITVRYANRSETVSGRVQNLTSPTLAVPPPALPSTDASKLSVKDVWLDNQGYTHLKVGGLAAAGLNTGEGNSNWVISDQVGTVWFNKWASHHYLTVNRIDSDTAELIFRTIRDESKSIFGDPSSPTMTLSAQNSPESTSAIYLAEFSGPAWTPRSGIDFSPGDVVSVSNEDELRAALAGSARTISLVPPQGTSTIVVRQPLRILSSVRIVGNGATLLFDQGNSAAWPAAVAGAIYVANPGVSEIAVEMENFSIKFADKPLRWESAPGSTGAPWDPMNNIYGLERAVIHTGDGQHIDLNGDGRNDIDQGNDNRNRTYIRLDRMNITGPPVFNPTPPPRPRDDPFGFGYEAAIEASIDILSTNGYDRGEITNSVFQGGTVSVAGGPWTITDNIVKGARAGAYSPSAFAVENGFDFTLSRNQVYQEDPKGRLFRLVIVARTSVNATISDNKVFGGVGLVGTESAYQRYNNSYTGLNNPEVILTESNNNVVFEGEPSALSADGRLVAIRDNYGKVDGSWGAFRAGSKLIASIISSPDPSLVGKWVQVSHLVSLTGSSATGKTATFMLQEAFPGLPDGTVISITDGSVQTEISGNSLDLTGKASVGIVLAGSNYGAEIVGNTIIGGTMYKYPYTGAAISVTAYPTNETTRNGTTINRWGWTYTPSFGVVVRDNEIWNSTAGVGFALMHIYDDQHFVPYTKSNSGRTYLAGDISDNRFYWSQSFFDDNLYAVTDSRFFPTVTIGSGFSGGPNPREYTPLPQVEDPDPWVVGDKRGFIDPKEINATVSGNRAFLPNASGTPTLLPSLAGQVYAGTVNGTAYTPDAPSRVTYNLRNLDIYGKPTVPPPSSTGRTIDDSPGPWTSDGFVISGDWTSQKASPTEAYLGDESKAKAVGKDATPTAVATWTFDNLQPGRYRISASWRAGSDRSPDAPFTIKDGNTTLKTIRTDQRSNPGTRDRSGIAWWTLGGDGATFDITGDRAVIQLGNNASGGFVIADGIRLERIGDIPTAPRDPLTADDADGNTADYSRTGSWFYYPVPADQGYLGDTSAAFAIGKDAAPTATATWSFSGLQPGRYRILGSWQPSDNRAPDAPFTIKDGSRSLGTVRMNQRHDSPTYAIAYDANGRPWWTLGGNDATFDITGSSASVTLSNNASGGFVIADGIRLERIGDIPTAPRDPLTADDADGNTADYSRTGSWFYYPVPADQGYLGDTSAAFAIGKDAAPTATATWSFSGLQPGRYRILGSWQPSDNRAPDAPFTIKDGSRSLGTVRMNQRHDSPTYAIAYDANGRPWWTLGGNDATFDITGSSASVTLSNNASGGFVIADGIRLERIGDIPAASTISAIARSASPAADPAPQGTTVAPPTTPTPSPQPPQFRRAAPANRTPQRAQKPNPQGPTAPRQAPQPLRINGRQRQILPRKD